jgi:hypothetical protein
MKLMRIGGLREALRNSCELAGYTTAAMKGLKPEVPKSVVDYLRAEQLGRIREIVFHFRDPAAGEEN